MSRNLANVGHNTMQADLAGRIRLCELKSQNFNVAHRWIALLSDDRQESSTITVDINWSEQKDNRKVNEN